MSLKASVEGVRQIDTSVWRAELNPSEVRRLGNTQSNWGHLSVLIVNNPTFLSERAQLEFELSGIKVLNVGNASDVIIISTSDEESKAELLTNEICEPQITIDANGDIRFLKELKELSPFMGRIGGILIQKIRREFHGSLKYHEKSRMYVESPVNFWAVRVQPRDKSLLISIYGSPPDYTKVKETINVKRGRTGYSTFKIKTIEEIDTAIGIIRYAFNLKRRR
ncbi:MAG: hypothetical protein A2Z09_06370 [Nitrospirae bacterium RBG_16_43_8]|nr:MAG: hypothetical protein A2Z09_06370 [Nitrospirae bacterium RBG_16_43_8]